MPPPNPAYYDVATLLQAGGFGTLGDDLYGGEWGASDAQILVLDSTAPASDLPDTFEQVGVQVLVRGAKSERDLSVYQRAKLMYDFLLTQSNCLDVNGVQYAGFEALSNLAALGKDENERFVYSMNFYTYRNGARGP